MRHVLIPYKRIRMILAPSVLLLSMLLAFSVTTQRTSAQSCSEVNRDIGSASFSVGIAEGASYKVWLRVSSPVSAGSVNLKINDSCHKEAGATDLSPNTLTWVNRYVDGSTISSNLAAGLNSLEIVGITESLAVDRILIIDSDCKPEGTGDNCLVTDETSPVVEISEPSEGSTVSGDVDMRAVVSDADTNLTVNFYINDQAYGTASKNSLSEWYMQLDTRNITNGTHELRVEAVDAAGNVGIDRRAFVIDNQDITQPPASTTPSIKLVATDDTFARSDRPNSTNENSTLHNDGKPKKITYVRFELPQNVEVTAAQLSLYAIDNSSSVIGVYATTDNWTEDTLNWNNRPQIGARINTINGTTDNDWVNVDVLNAIQDGARFLSLAIQTDDDFLTRFNSKEKQRGDTGPFLYIDTKALSSDNDDEVGSDPDQDGSNGQNPVEPANPSAPERTLNSSTHTVAEDAFARSDQPLSTAETNSLHADTKPEKISYLKFNLADLAGRSVTKATLRLYSLENAFDGGIVSTVSNDSWSEKTLNWNNRPSVNNDSIAVIGAVSIDSWIEIDLSLTSVDPDGVLTLAIRSDSDELARYQSVNQDRGAFAAELLLTTY